MFYVNVATCVLALVGWIMLLVTNGVEGNKLENAGVAIALGIIGVLLIAGGTFASLKFGSQHFITAAIRLLGLVCVMIMVLFLVMGRAETAAAALTYEGNEGLTVQAFYTAVVSGVFSLVAVLAIIVTSFFTTEKKI